MHTSRIAAGQGFTIIELLVVVGIIGILVAMAIPMFGAAEAHVKEKTCFSNQRSLEGAVQSYQASRGALPAPGLVDSTHPLVTQGYVKSAPYCPASSAGAAGNYGLDGWGSISTFPAGCDHGPYR